MRLGAAALGSGSMDAMGDADELARDDHVPPPRRPLVTSEALALAGLVLVAMSPLMANLFQFLAFVLSPQIGVAQTPAWQYVIYTAPSGLVAALGAGLGVHASRDQDLTGWGRTVAGAAVAVGTFILAVVIVGAVVGFAVGDDSF